MNLKDVMDQVGDALESITDLNVFRFPPYSLTPPAVVVSYPEQYNYDSTYGRGMDRIPDLQVVVVEGRPTDHSTRDRLAAYADGSGPRSIKQAIEAGTYTACDSVRVVSVLFDPVDIGGTTYMAALFEVDIAGSGK